jgi:hypothetical protein
VENEDTKSDDASTIDRDVLGGDQDREAEETKGDEIDGDLGLREDLFHVKPDYVHHETGDQLYGYDPAFSLAQPYFRVKVISHALEHDTHACTRTHTHTLVHDTHHCAYAERERMERICLE